MIEGLRHRAKFIPGPPITTAKTVLFILMHKMPFLTKFLNYPKRNVQPLPDSFLNSDSHFLIELCNIS